MPVSWNEKRQSEEHITHKSPGQRKVKQNHVSNGNLKLPELVKESWSPRKRKMDKGPGFYQQDKAKEKLGASDDKKDEDNGLQKSDNKKITFKDKSNKDLDHLVNSLEKDTEIKENETKIRSEKFVPDGDTSFGKKKKRPYQEEKVKIDFTRRKKRKCEPIARKKSPILINDELRNKMVESDGGTVLFSTAQC